MVDLIDRFVAILERFAACVEVEIEQEPPVIVAYARSGRVFAAAWMADDGLVVRLRLDAHADPAGAFEHIDGGALTYEAVIRTVEELDALETTLHRSERLAARLQSN